MHSWNSGHHRSFHRKRIAGSPSENSVFNDIIRHAPKLWKQMHTGYQSMQFYTSQKAWEYVYRRGSTCRRTAHERVMHACMCAPNYAACKCASTSRCMHADLNVSAHIWGGNSDPCTNIHKRTKFYVQITHLARPSLMSSSENPCLMPMGCPKRASSDSSDSWLSASAFLPSSFRERSPSPSPSPSPGMRRFVLLLDGV